MKMKKKLYTAVLILLFNLSVFAQGVKEGLLEYGIKIPYFIAGFFGALLLISKEKYTRTQNILIVASGAGTANFMTGFILELLHFQSKEAGYFFAFVCGTSGIKIVSFAIDKFFTPTKTETK